MNIRDLEYLVAVASTRHFGHAAERCFVSQPTLSGQIGKLEDELRVILFERTKRSVEVTPAGEAIVAQAKEVLEQVAELRALATCYQDPLSGSLRLGVIPTLSPYLMPLIFGPLNEQYPQMKLVLSEELTDQLLSRVKKHEIDAALVATPVEDQSLKTRPLFDEPFWLVYPSSNPLAKKRNIQQGDLDSMDLLLLSEGHCLAEQAMNICHIQERSQRGDMADLRAASLETLLQMVEVGLGSTLLPALAVKTTMKKNAAIECRELNLPDTFRRVSLVFRTTFPRKQALNCLADVMMRQLPATVGRL